MHLFQNKLLSFHLGKLAKNSQDVLHNTVHKRSEIYQSCSGDDNGTKLAEVGHINKGPDSINNEVVIIQLSYCSINSTDTDSARQIERTETLTKFKQQSQEIVEQKSNMCTDYEEFELYMKKVGLRMFFPEKLQITDVLKLEANEKPPYLKGIATMFIRSLFMMNFSCRDTILEKYTDNIPLPKGKTSDSIENNNKLNPLDLILAVFKCSSPKLKQILATKLFECHLAIPLVFPAVGNDQMLVNFWPLRSLVVYREREEISFPYTAAECPFPIVSFIRFGRPTFSKSKLMNQILTEPYQNTFLNKDCPLGTTKRLFSEGMIEIVWHLSSKKSSVNTPCIFLNVRGDGTELSEQLNLVSKISSVVIITMEATGLDNIEYQKLRLALHKQKIGAILAIDANDESRNRIRQKLHTNFDINPQFEKQTSFILLCLEDQEKQITMLKSEMRNQIERHLQNKRELSLTERLYACTAELDEDNFCFLSTKKMAKKVIQCIRGESTKFEKNQVVPLQGDLCWEWNKKNREMNKTSEDAVKQKLCMEQTIIREKQLMACKKLSPFMHSFINTLVDVSGNKCVLFVLWLNLFLDERSRSILPKYLLKYQSNWQALRVQKEIDGMKVLFEKLDANEYDLVDASFGLEHLFREMGQIYETLSSCISKDLTMNQLQHNLPNITAKLLLLGFPFEIMDGDTGNIPISWVTAVLMNLKDIVADKKMLALSVLSVQSSGRSTLLNTIFGLQFIKCSSRCTRGVFMQLVPVNETVFPFDYLLVLTIEGLRAFELGEQKYNDDNELATFAICLADITFLDIKGDSSTEIVDILEVSVYGLLRLKLTNKRLDLKKCYVLVHQNSPATNKLKLWKQELVEMLDVITKEAADRENISDICYFNQVIEFDCDKNIWFLPELSLCDTQMLRVNLIYSEKVATVRSAIEFELKAERQTYHTVTGIISRIGYLRDRILKDDLVIRLRLNLKAFIDNERKCRMLFLELEKFIFEFKMYVAEFRFVTFRNPSDIQNDIPCIIKQLKLDFEDKVASILSEIDAFVNKNTLYKIMIQWKHKRKNSVKMLAKDLILTSERQIIIRKDEISFENIQIRNRTKNEQDINEMVKQLALQIRGKSINELSLKRVFEKIWKIWLDLFRASDDEDGVSIRHQIRSIFPDEFPSDAPYVKGTYDEHDYARMEKLESTVPFEWITEEHIQIHEFFFIKKDNLSNCRRQAYKITNKFLSKIDKKLLELNTQCQNLYMPFVTEIVRFVVTDIDEHNSEKAKNYNFDFLPSFRAMILAHVLRYATILFTRLNDEYNRTHSPQFQVNSYKETAWMLFKNIVMSKSEEVIALEFFKETIITKVIEHVSVVLFIDAEDKILKLFFNGKFSVIKKILIQLAQEENFGGIQSFIEDPSAYAEQWMKGFSNDKLFGEYSDGMNLITRLAKLRICKIFRKLSKSIVQASESTETSIKVWIEQFVKHSNNSKILPLAYNTFEHVKDRHILDVQTFVEMLKGELGEIQTHVIDIFKEKAACTLKWKTHLLISIMDKLWGCKEVCMFCGEPCMFTYKNHINTGHCHRCSTHRPEGISGKRCSITGKLKQTFCNHSVKTNDEYEDVRGKTGKYREYKEHFTDWAIDAHADVSKFWMWIFFKYQKELTKMYDAQISDVPENWVPISKSEAIHSLG